MTPFISTRTRAGLLVLALALVGGTGCAVMVGAAQVAQDTQSAVHAARRNARIAWLKPLVDKGDPAATAETGGIMVSAARRGSPEEKRGLDLLSYGAGKGDARGQAILAERSLDHEPNNPEVIARSIAMLQRAATHACRFKRYGITDKEPLSPYGTLVYYLKKAGRTEEAKLWEARGVMHCQEPDTPLLARRAAHENTRYRDTMPDLVLLLLTDSPADIKNGMAGYDPVVVESATREAARLREQVALSERDYPAPTRKELP